MGNALPLLLSASFILVCFGFSKAFGIPFVPLLIATAVSAALFVVALLAIGWRRNG